MLSCSASAGSWTRQTPPRSLTATVPAAPSSRAPESTTDTSRAPSADAAVRNSTSTAGRWPFSLGPRESVTASSSTTRCLPGAATSAVPGRNGSPSAACRTGSGPARSRMCGSALRPDAGTWRTISTQAGKSAGSRRISAVSASTPPAEAPTTTTSRRRPGMRGWGEDIPPTTRVGAAHRTGSPPGRSIHGHCGSTVAAVPRSLGFHGRWGSTVAGAPGASPFG